MKISLTSVFVEGPQFEAIFEDICRNLISLAQVNPVQQ